MAKPYRLEQLDAVEFVQSVPDESVDLVITDPAYESLEKWRAMGTTTRLSHSKQSSNDWFHVFPDARYEEFLTECYRCMKPDSHIYIHCDETTRDVLKPVLQKVGFTYWKSIVWNKCLDPDTLVRTQRGVIKIKYVTDMDSVYTIDGRLVGVKSIRHVTSDTVTVVTSDGIKTRVSPDHKFILESGTEIEARQLQRGQALLSGRSPDSPSKIIDIRKVFAIDDVLCELLTPRNTCLWCGSVFDAYRNVAAHQARWCEKAISKKTIAELLHVDVKVVKYWLDQGLVPARWLQNPDVLKAFNGKLSDRYRLMHARYKTKTYASDVNADYSLGFFLGLFAAEGSSYENCVSFAFNSDEHVLHEMVAAYARRFGARTSVVAVSENGVAVRVNSDIVAKLVTHYIGGATAHSKFVRSNVYEEGFEFRKGIMDGLLHGDGHWSMDEQRITYATVSDDLAMFVLRQAREQGFEATAYHRNNDYRGYWSVRWDPSVRHSGLVVTEVVKSPIAIELIDIAIDDPGQVFQLGSGMLTHNCAIGMGYHWRNTYELIVFAEKGKRRLNELGLSDVVTAPEIDQDKANADIIHTKRLKGPTYYPTEKPVEIAQQFVLNSSSEKNVVMDPFMGSGSVGHAAIATGRAFLGNDIDERSLAYAGPRLDAVYQEFVSKRKRLKELGVYDLTQEQARSLVQQTRT